MPEPEHIGGLLGPALARITALDENHLDRWITRTRALRGCACPVRLTGETTRVDGSTGELLSRYSTATEPGNELLMRCKNRRASRCPSCSEEYRADTYHLVKAGIVGGDKGVPTSVGVHPRAFVTLTAPSFGAVHRGPGKDGRTRVCHPRRTDAACFKHHRADDPRIGQPLDPTRYDYVGHVLWHAHTGELWRRFTLYLRNHLASAAGLSRTAFSKRVRISYAKVAEFQSRGAVHFHAVIRLDGYTKDPTGWPPPPVWASMDMLTAAVDSAARTVSLTSPEVSGRTWTLAWGEQVDVRPIEDFGPDRALTDTAVAGYIAKYATKAAEDTGTLDRRIHDIDHVDMTQVRTHAGKLIYTCWRLGNARLYPQLEDLKLRQWAHMLGFRGHFSTKSRRYSTTLGALRQVRADYAAGRPWDTETFTPLVVQGEEDSTLSLGNWHYLGQGLTPGEWALASLVAGMGRSTEDAEVDR
ncbi:replication initiator [Nocardiopsis sp. RV163]|uniref:replication initiator n=1 Tax=Nocardiopsis sp. RV163 TaxID=1661388 RepID=UPI00064C3A0A|nr:replication initiator [Nocardiopsis sp. RV163]